MSGDYFLSRPTDMRGIWNLGRRGDRFFGDSVYYIDGGSGFCLLGGFI